MRIALLAAVVLVSCAAPSETVAPVSTPAASPSATEVFGAVKAKDAPRLEALLAADPSLASAKNEKGSPLVLVALFQNKGKEGFERPGENALLRVVLAHHPSLDRFALAALGEASLVRAEVAKDAGYVSARHKIGWTPLHFAAFGGNARAAEVLLERGAEVNALADNKFRNTPLQVAMLTAQIEVARVLLLRGADPRIKQEAGFTALHEAVQAGSEELARALLEAGADPRAKADDGRTPLDLAQEAGRAELVKLLEGGRKRD
jgi:ankyrin repeat protein